MKRNLLLLLLVGCCACTPKHVLEQLDNADRWMHEQPTHALAILDSLDQSRLNSRKSRARYALLYSQALDKNYVDIASDSLLQPALRYYNSGRGTAHDRMLVNYLMGRIHYNAGNYLPAMSAFLIAEEEAEKSNDAYLLGLLYSYMGFLHEQWSDYYRCLESHERALACYKKAGVIRQQNHTNVCIANSLLSLKNYDQAEGILLSTKQWAEEQNDNYIYRSCVENLIQLYEYTNQYDQLSRLMDENRLLYVQLDQKQHPITSKDRLHQTLKSYSIARLAKNYKQALLDLERVVQIQDSMLRRSLQHPMVGVQRDYFQSQADFVKYKLHKNRQLSVVSISLLLLLIVVLSVVTRYRLMKKELTINQYIDLAREFEEKKKRVDTQTASMNGQIRRLFKGQYDLLDQLSKVYYETHFTRHDKEAIYSRVQKEIEAFCSNKQTIAQLEKVVNDYKNNVIGIIRNELPHFTEAEIRFLCYIYAGFSAKAISVFTNDSIGNIYTKKSRIRSEILQKQPINVAIIIDEMP